MRLSDRQMLDALSRMPFIDSVELALILGESHSTAHRVLSDLLADGIASRVSHGTSHLPSSQRYYLTANGIRETAGLLGFDTPSEFVRAYPMSREWLRLLIYRMDALASVYRLAATLSPGTDDLRTQVEFHRRGRLDAFITLQDGRSFSVVHHPGLELAGNRTDNSLHARTLSRGDLSLGYIGGVAVATKEIACPTWQNSWTKCGTDGYNVRIETCSIRKPPQSW